MLSLIWGKSTHSMIIIDADKKTWCNANDVSCADKTKEIVKLCYNNAEQTEICCGLRDQTVVIHSAGSTMRTLTLFGGEGPFKGLAKMESDFLTCTESGVLKIWKDDGEQKLEKTIGTNTCFMNLNEQQRHLVAAGGKENELKVWDLQRPDAAAVFSAKNPAHNWVNLREPIWVLDASFLSGSERIAACSSYHRIRIYDPKSQRRPIIDMEYGDSPITTLSCRSNEHHFMAGNSHGGMALFDIRGKGYKVQDYKGSLGGLRQVLCHPRGDVVASAGLDRFVRIHDIDSRQLLQKFYVKSRLNCLLFQDICPTLKEEEEDDKEEERTDIFAATQIDMSADGNENDSDDDPLWANMEVVKDARLKRKSKAQSGRELKQAHLEQTIEDSKKLKLKRRKKNKADK